MRDHRFLAAPSQLRPRFPGLPLAGSGVPVCVFPPEGREGPALAALVQACIEEKTGERPHVFRGLDPEGALQSWHAILLGPLGSQRAVEAIYHRGWTCSDAVFPGPDGRLVQSLHNLWNTGTHAVLVASSSHRGLAAAVESFGEAILALGDSLFPFTYEVAAGAAQDRPCPGPGTESGLDAAVCLDSFMRSGRQEFLDSFRTRTQEAPGERQHPADLTGESFPARTQEAVWRGPGHQDPRPWFGLAETVSRWRVLEDHPFFSEEDRLKVVNWLFASARAACEWLRNAGPASEGPRQRGEEMLRASIGLCIAAEYFGRFYRIEEAAEWMDAARPALEAPTNSTSSSLYAAAVRAACAVRSGNSGPLASGEAWKAAQQVLWWTDNLGRNACEGFESPENRSSRARMLRLMRTWYREPVFEWGLQHFFQDCPPAAGDFEITGIEPRRPDEWLGVRLIPPLGPAKAAGGMSGRPSRGPDDSAPSRPTGGDDPLTSGGFDAAFLRNGFGPGDDYLAVTGRDLAAAGRTGSIRRLTARGRIWILEPAAGGGTGHDPKPGVNSVAVLRDGQPVRCPGRVILEMAQDLPHCGFLRFRVPDFGGLDWHRTLVWWKGVFVVVADELAARAPGCYSVECRFHLLGTPEARGTGILFDQKGATLGMTGTGTTETALSDECLPNTARLKSYPYASPLLRVHRASRSGTLPAGGRWRLAHQFHLAGGPCAVEEAGGDLLRVQCGPRVYWVGLGPVEGPSGLATDASLFAATDGRVAVVQAQRFFSPDFRFQSRSGPMSRELAAAPRSS
ncbi:MAG: hypothetical protein HYU36_19645 [Planctomycetes bacterium]|nr:hypothetical protein [Planctomycetota bacterium]